MIACAKIIGITPEAFNFNGINCLAPNIFFSYSPEAVLRAYWTGIFLTAITSSTLSSIITNQITSSISTNINEDEANSCANDKGNVAIIPTIINIDIPLPIPLSVIFSPSHIANTQPVTRMIVEETKNIGVLPSIKAAEGTPKASKPKR